MEKTEASAILGIAIEASASEVEEAYDKRMGEVRKRFDAARGMSVRAQCKREFAAIKEARDSLLTELGQIRPTQPMGAGAPVTEQFGEKPPVEEPLEEKPPVA